MSTETVPLTEAQAAAFARFARLKVGAVFMEQGTGKSRVAVELANDRCADGAIDAVLWVTPLSVVATAKAEAAKWRLATELRVVGYESLSQSDRTYLEVLDWCKGRQFLVIADESIFIKNAWSKRHQRMREIRRHAKYALALNGTPLTRDPWDIKRQMDWLSPRILNLSDRAFQQSYFKLVQIERGLDRRYWWEVYEPNIAHLRSLIAPYVHEARLHLDVDEEHEEVVHDPSGTTEVTYEGLRDEFLESWGEFANEIELYRLLGRLAKVAACDTRKAKAVAKAVEGRPVIVFSRFIDEQDLIVTALEGRCLVVRGSTPRDEREELLDRSRVEDVPLLLTFGTGSFGLNLQHRSELHFSSVGWDYGQVSQAQARIRRLGQREATRVVTHRTSLGIDSMIARNLAFKDVLAGLVRHELDPRAVL